MDKTLLASRILLVAANQSAGCLQIVVNHCFELLISNFLKSEVSNVKHSIMKIFIGYIKVASNFTFQNQRIAQSDDSTMDVEDNKKGKHFSSHPLLPFSNQLFEIFGSFLIASGNVGKTDAIIALAMLCSTEKGSSPLVTPKQVEIFVLTITRILDSEDPPPPEIVDATVEAIKILVPTHSEELYEHSFKILIQRCTVYFFETNRALFNNTMKALLSFCLSTHIAIEALKIIFVVLEKELPHFDFVDVLLSTIIECVKIQSSKPDFKTVSRDILDKLMQLILVCEIDASLTKLLLSHSLLSIIIIGKEMDSPADIAIKYMNLFLSQDPTTASTDHFFASSSSSESESSNFPSQFRFKQSPFSPLAPTKIKRTVLPFSSIVTASKSHIEINQLFNVIQIISTFLLEKENIDIPFRSWSNICKNLSILLNFLPEESLANYFPYIDQIYTAISSPALNQEHPEVAKRYINFFVWFIKALISRNHRLAVDYWGKTLGLLEQLSIENAQILAEIFSFFF
jgi:hypothetical protein